MNKKVKELIKGSDKKTLAVYFILRFFVILVMLVQIFHHNWQDVFLCFLTLILFIIPFVIDRKLKIDLPTPLEIIILLFIFSAEILGEIQNFYGQIPYWDTMLHTINGFLCGAIGFSMIDILNRNEKLHITLTPIFVAFVGFCFSMTIGVLWEFFEFSGDYLLNMDMQKDRIVDSVSSVYLNEEGKNVPVVIENIDHTTIYYRENNEIKETTISGYLDIGIIDTMKDLLVNFLGAVVFSVIGYLYIKNRDKYTIVEKFIPVMRK